MVGKARATSVFQHLVHPLHADMENVTSDSATRTPSKASPLGWTTSPALVFHPARCHSFVHRGIDCILLTTRVWVPQRRLAEGSLQDEDAAHLQGTTATGAAVATDGGATVRGAVRCPEMEDVVMRCLKVRGAQGSARPHRIFLEDEARWA